MKTPRRTPSLLPGALDRALAAHLAATSNRSFVPSPELRLRCRTAAHAALQLAKLRKHRPALVAQPGSLQQHFQALARRARLKLSRLFAELGFGARASAAPGLRELTVFARHLGLTLDEVLWRVHCEFAGLAASTDAPVRARGQFPSAGALRTPADIDRALRACESTYSSARRTELSTALATVAEVYGAAI